LWIFCAKVIQINRCINRQKFISCVEVIFRYWNLIPNAEVSICFVYHPCFFFGRKKEEGRERKKPVSSSATKVCVCTQKCVSALPLNKRVCVCMTPAPIKLKHFCSKRTIFGAFKTTSKKTWKILKFKSRSKSVCTESVCAL